MPELRELQRKLDSVEVLGEVVSAMRNLAAIYVRRAEAAIQAIRPYTDVIDASLHAILARTGMAAMEPSSEPRALALVFASDQGLCGTYNERVVRAALDFKAGRTGPLDFIAVGRRGSELLTKNGVAPVFSAPAPTSLEGIKAQVADLAADVFEKYAELNATEMFFIYNAYESMGRFKEETRRVLPPDADSFSGARVTAFTYEPILTAAPAELLGDFIEEYFFIQLYRALFEGHASENAARLVSMTAAGANIDERCTELTRQYQSARQDSITAELLDVIGGAEALAREAG